MRMVDLALLRRHEGNVLHPQCVRILIENFAGQHDEQVWRCFCELVGVAPEARAASVRASTSLPPAAGGLGLRTAFEVAPGRPLGQLG